MRNLHDDKEFEFKSKKFTDIHEKKFNELRSNSVLLERYLEDSFIWKSKIKYKKKSLKDFKKLMDEQKRLENYYSNIIGKTQVMLWKQNEVNLKNILKKDILPARKKYLEIILKMKIYLKSQLTWTVKLEHADAQKERFYRNYKKIHPYLSDKEIEEDRIAVRDGERMLYITKEFKSRLLEAPSMAKIIHAY